MYVKGSLLQSTWQLQFPMKSVRAEATQHLAGSDPNTACRLLNCRIHFQVFPFGLVAILPEVAAPFTLLLCRCGGNSADQRCKIYDHTASCCCLMAQIGLTQISLFAGNHFTTELQMQPLSLLGVHEIITEAPL